MGDPQQEKPRIHIDSDWKAEAQAEKERLAEQDKAKAAAGEGGAGAPGPGQLPPADFQSLMSMLINPALLYMGAIPDPQTGQGIVHLELARHHIDMLSVLEKKTKGNLTDEESKMLSQVQHELRLNFLQISKQVAEHLEKQGAGGKVNPKMKIQPPGR